MIIVEADHLYRAIEAEGAGSNILYLCWYKHKEDSQFNLNTANLYIHSWHFYSDAL